MSINTIAILLADGYKHVHAEQYPKGLTKLVSYMTPRMSRLKDCDKMIFFGLQAFCEEYLVEYFNDNFFNIPEDKVIEEYRRVIDSMLGKNTYNIEKIRDLHKLGYLPLQIRAL